MGSVVAPAERLRLRELAKRQLELACAPQMEELRKRHWDLNTKTAGTRPVVRIETEPLRGELISEGELRCSSPVARRIEEQLLFRLRHWELVADDRLVPKTYQIEWQVEVDYFGFPIDKEVSAPTGGRAIGYKINHAIKNIAADFGKLKPLTAAVSRAPTEEYRDAAAASIGDILPVEMVGWPTGATFLTRNLMEIMSMEDFYIAMLDEPEAVHQIMEYLLGNAVRLMRFYEGEGIMHVNNGEQDLKNSTYPFTDRLPAPGFGGTPRLRDMFLRTDSQETVGVSPGMFAEFCLPYYQRLCRLGGLWYYGCCEPVHAVWDGCLSTIANIKKLSISKWCDEEIMGHFLANSGIVYSRKLDATFLGVDAGIDEAGIAGSIRATMRHAGGCQIEFISRDLLSVHGNLKKLGTAAEIMRREIASALGG
ncbi:MAG: hypothetical protein LBL83_07095 [Clostridiales bacterium]|jgi:hypothetical protein|nr:hypothetical protein [Clostridiales bacterium]